MLKDQETILILKFPVGDGTVLNPISYLYNNTKLHNMASVMSHITLAFRGDVMDKFPSFQFLSLTQGERLS